MTQETERSIESEPAVSIIVCAYKSGRKILPTIRSILDQSFSQFELIVIDDASKDDTSEIVRSVQDERIKLVVNENNLGVVASRNLGVGIAKGKYIAHCDHDDTWKKTKLEKQVSFLERNPDYGLVSTSIAKFQDGKLFSSGESKDRSSDYLAWSLLVDSTFAHSAIMYRRDLIEAQGIQYDTALTFADDWDMFFKIAKCSKIGSIPEPLTEYRLHESNWSNLAASEMCSGGKQVLHREINSWLNNEVDFADANLYFDSIVSGVPCSTVEDLIRVGTILNKLKLSYIESVKPSKQEREQIFQCAERYWWKVVAQSSNKLGPLSIKQYWAEKTPGSKSGSIGIRALLTRVFKSFVNRYLRKSV